MAETEYSTDWSAVQERGSTLGLRFMVTVFRFLGRRICLVLLAPVIGYFFVTGRGSRKASLDYLTRVSVYRQKNAHPSSNACFSAPNLWESYCHFYEFGRAVVDRVALWMGDRNFYLSWHDKQRDEFLKLLDARQGALLLGAHLGNVEVLRALSQERFGMRVNAFMYTKHAASFNTVLRKLNPDSGIRLIPLESVSASTAIELNERIAKGEFVSMLADRVAAGSRDRVLTVPFLGKGATFPIGPFIFASLLNAPVYLIFALRTGDASYEIHFEKFADRIAIPRKDRESALIALLHQFVARLEYYCALAPYQWFNFYDFWSASPDAELQQGYSGADRFPVAAGSD